MSGFMSFILTGYVSFGLLCAALARPLMRREIRPNSLYGFRVRRTLDDPAVWYDANAFAGRCFFWLGLGLALASLGLYFVPGMDPVVYALVCLALMMTGLAVCLILSFRFLARLPGKESP